MFPTPRCWEVSRFCPRAVGGMVLCLPRSTTEVRHGDGVLVWASGKGRVLCGRDWDWLGGILHASENAGGRLGRWLLTYMRAIIGLLVHGRFILVF